MYLGISLKPFLSYFMVVRLMQWVGDCLQAHKPIRHVISYTGQLSLAIPSWVGAMSMDDRYGYQ